VEKFNDILKKLLFESNLTMTALASEIGISKQYLSDALTKNRNFSSEKYIKIFTFFDKLFKDKFNKELNLRWYMTGQGPMFLSEVPDDENTMTIHLRKGQMLKVVYEE